MDNRADSKIAHQAYVEYPSRTPPKRARHLFDLPQMLDRRERGANPLEAMFRLCGMGRDNMASFRPAREPVQDDREGLRMERNSAMARCYRDRLDVRP